MKWYAAEKYLDKRNNGFAWVAYGFGSNFSAAISYIALSCKATKSLLVPLRMILKKFIVNKI